MPKTCATWANALLSVVGGPMHSGPVLLQAVDDLRLVGLKLIFLIVSPVAGAEIVTAGGVVERRRNSHAVRHQLAVADGTRGFGWQRTASRCRASSSVFHSGNGTASGSHGSASSDVISAARSCTCCAFRTAAATGSPIDNRDPGSGSPGHVEGDHILLLKIPGEAQAIRRDTARFSLLLGRFAAAELEALGARRAAMRPIA